MNQPEATVAICKCKETKKTYGVRLEKISADRWKYTWAFPMKESSARREGYDSTTIKGSIEPDDEYPGWPYCGGKYFVVCGGCGKLNCKVVKSKIFTCEWCGYSGMLVGYAGTGIAGGGDR